MTTSNIKLPGWRKRYLATKLTNVRASVARTEQSADLLTVVCISDTHGNTPDLPDGDLLLHAGDMTEWGSFNEIQSQLSWLSSQPHKHKVIIAGNHDVLLDEQYMASSENTDRLPWKSEDHATRSHLDFGSCIYLENESVMLTFDNGRKLRIYGSPITRKAAGNSAFQVTTDTWTERVPSDTDILLSHGPPSRHLDGFPHAGCSHLLQEVIRVRPRFVVCGHIHVGHGREDVLLDRVGSDYEGIMAGWYGYEGVLTMALSLLWDHICLFFHRLTGRSNSRNRISTLINAAVVSGRKNEVTKDPIVVQI